MITILQHISLYLALNIRAQLVISRILRASISCGSVSLTLIRSINIVFYVMIRVSKPSLKTSEFSDANCIADFFSRVLFITLLVKILYCYSCDY